MAPKRKKGSQKNKRRSAGDRPQLVAMRHPLSGVDPSVVKDAILQMAVQKAEEFPEHLAAIVSLVKRSSPHHILAVISNYALTASVTDEGVGDHGMLKDVEQHHVELFQALMLSVKQDEWGVEPGASGDIQEAIDTLGKLADAFHQRRFQAAAQAQTDEERTVLGLQERIRLHTQAVRNWGYLGDVIDISTELYSALDDRFAAVLGFSASDLLIVSKSIISLIDERGQERFRKLRRIFRERKIPRLVKRYYAENPHFEGTAEGFLRSIPPSASLERVASTLLSHADLELPRLLTVEEQEVASKANLPVERVSAVLKAISLQPGSVEASNREHFFLSNPIWTAPFVQLRARYFCPAPQGVFSHIHDIMRSLAERAGLKSALEERRATYLEAKVGELMRKALPTAQIVDGAKWASAHTEYETDHIAKIDRTILIVEDKSASLTSPALRGAPDRIKRHLQDLVFAPSEQSSRLESLIWRSKERDPEAIAQLAPLGLDFSDAEAIVRLSVTLDDFSIVCSAEVDLKEAGLLPAGMELATTLNIADLNVIVDILETPTAFVHYFIEHSRFQKALNVFADEMDFLGFYLETGFNIWLTEVENSHIALTGMSQSIDRYYNSRDAGMILRKPCPKMSPYFARLIKHIEERRPRRWLTVGIELMRACSFEEQRKVERMLDQLRDRVRRSWRTEGHENSMIITPPEIRKTAIAFYVFPSQLTAMYKEIAEGLAHQILNKTDQKRCIIISRNLDHWDREYEAIHIFEAQQEPSKSQGTEHI